MPLITPSPAQCCCRVLTPSRRLFPWRGASFFPATMAEPQWSKRAACADNSTRQPQPYPSRAVNTAPATGMEYFNTTPSRPQRLSSPLAHLHPTLLQLLSSHLARYCARPAELSPFKQAPRAFRNARPLHLISKQSTSSSRNRPRSSSRHSKLSTSLRHILE